MAKSTTKPPAEGSGAARSAREATEGAPGLLRRLSGEHARISTLFERIIDGSESDARSELFDELEKELLAHGKGEEKVLYPTLRQHPELVEAVDLSLEVHRRIAQRLTELSRGDRRTPEWLGEIGRLRDDVGAHVEHEEQVIFPRAEQLVPRDRLDRLLEDHEREEARVHTDLDGS